MHHLLLKTVSVFAFILVTCPVLAQDYSAATNDPYGYGSVPLPHPPLSQRMLMPSYQAQRTVDATASSRYAGQATPHPVTTAQMGMIPNYLPEHRSQANVQTIPSPSTTQQASSVGYVVQPSQQAPQASPYGAPVMQAAPQAYAPQPSPQPYAQPTYNAPASYAAPLAPVQQVMPQQVAPQMSSQVPSSYSAANAAVQNSITTAAPMDNAPVPSYQPQNTYQANSYQGYQDVPSQAPQQGYAPQPYADASQMLQQAPQPVPQVQPYAYNEQPQTYTTTQIYTPSPALTVQHGSDDYQGSSRAAADNVSLATDPSVGPWYVALRSGLTLAQDTGFDTVASSSVINDYQTGWQLGAGVGYEFKAFNSWVAPRAEIELTYDQQLVDAHTINGTKTSDPNAYGFQRNLDVLANGYLDFRLNRYLSPYVGTGVGFGYSDFDRYGTSAGGVIMDDNDVGFVWQAMGGLGINLSNNAMVDFGYRFQQNTGVNLTARDGTITTPDVSKHVIMVGFRNNF